MARAARERLGVTPQDVIGSAHNIYLAALEQATRLTNTRGDVGGPRSAEAVPASFGGSSSRPGPTMRSWLIVVRE
jgi:hypothetical protein